MSQTKIRTSKKLYFKVHSYIFCGDSDVSDFLFAYRIHSDEIWRNLKQKAVDIEYHLGEAFSYAIPENISRDCVLARYDPSCESEPLEYSGAGESYVRGFHLFKKDFLKYYAKEYTKFEKFKNLKRIRFYSRPAGFFIDEDQLIFRTPKSEKPADLQILFRIGTRMAIIKRLVDGSIFTAKYIESDLSIPKREIDEHLEDIIDIIEGSASCGVSITDVLLRHIDDTLEPCKSPSGLLKGSGIDVSMNVSQESYQSKKYKEILTLMTWQCAIDDYDVVLFTGTTQFQERNAFIYDSVLGWIKKPE